MNFQTIKPGDRLKGLIPGETIQIITTQPVGDDAIEVYYRRNDGSLGQR
jgi:Fe2+ transport system protein FeoA